MARETLKEEDVGKEAIDPSLSEEDLKAAKKRLLHLFRMYKEWRETNQEHVWDMIYDAYHGIPLWDAFPYGAQYIIREVFRQIESLKPQVADIILPDDSLFEYKASVEGSEDDALAATAIVHQHLEVLNLREQIQKWLDAAVQWGTSYLRYGWDTFEHTKRKITRAHSEEEGDFWQRDTEEVLVDGPVLEHLNHWKVYTDPFEEDLRDSPVVFVREIVSGTFLKTEIKEERFDFRATKKLINEGGEGRQLSLGNVSPERSFQNEDDELLAKFDDIGEFELLTCYTNDGWIYTIVQDEIVQAQENPFGKVPILTLRNYPQLDEHYGTSEAEVIMGDQRLLNDIASMWVDGIHLTENPFWLVKSSERKNFGITTFKPGGVAYLDELNGVIPLPVNPTTFNLTNAMGTVKQNMQLATGITNEITGSSSQRTATGIVRLQDAAGVRIRHKVRLFIPAFKELYRILYNLESDFLDDEVAVQIAGEKGDSAFELFGPDKFQQSVDVEVSVAPNMATPQERQNKWVGLWQQIGQDQRFNFEPVALEMLRAYDVKNPRRAIANPAHSQEDALAEAQQFLSTGVYPLVRPTDNHEIHLQIMQFVEALPLFQEMEPTLQGNHENHKQEHLGFLQQQQGAAQGGPPGGGGSETDLRTEAQFGNAVTGAQQQGTLPQGGF